tara:strand:+ start:38266 stop:38928 length:663 start_codon:yes stop_codon:yes gene_type:complete
LPSQINQNASVLGLWLFPVAAPLKQITLEEKKWASQLSPKRKKEFIHSRGYARLALSTRFQVNPLEIPLHSLPGQAPELARGWGYISISHCKDALLIGWSEDKIGVDIERSDRLFNPEKLINLFLSDSEKETLNNKNLTSKRKLLLSNWVIKEAAIKWQRGTLYKDIKQWVLNENQSEVLHQSLKLIIKTEFITFRSWYIGIACNKKSNLSPPILCFNKL